ncbi:MAG: cytochrome c, partial [Halocynthiibacter sp.]
MKRSYMRLYVVIAGALVLGAIIFAVRWWRVDAVAQTGMVIPQLSTMAAQGKIDFNTSCARCHGVNAAGTDKGPPLVHDIYNPGHHADEAFFRAVKNGVPQHHWPYGNMPARPEVNDRQLNQCVRLVRVQVPLPTAHGIG